MKKAKFTLNDVPPKADKEESEDEEIFQMDEDISEGNSEDDMTSLPTPPAKKKAPKPKKAKKEKLPKIKKEKIPKPPKEKKPIGRPRRIPGDLDPISAEAISYYVSKCREVHGDKYQYHIDHYPGCTEKIKITCKEHGPFEQRSTNHLRGSGCQRCARKKPTTFPKNFKIGFVFENSRAEDVDLFERECVEVAKRLNMAVEVRKGRAFR